MRRFPVLFVAALLCFLPSCVLGVAWLPDSSGFVFTTPKGHLVAYDYNTKKQHVVLEDAAAATTAWPAISPDGKKIALVHLSQGDKNEAVLQFVICNLKGLVESRSDKLKLTAIQGKDLQFSTQVSWFPDAKKLLVHGQGVANQGEGFDNTALFDIATNKLEVWEKHVPAYFGNSPIRPDGAGFLLAGLTSKDDVGEYAWVDWNGKKQKIASAKRRPFKDEPQPWTALSNSRWAGDQAIVMFPKHRYVIDTKTLKEKFEPVPPSETMIAKEAIRMRTMLASGVELLVLEHDDGDKGGAAVRVVARKKGDPALTEVIAPFRDRIPLLSPSPDRTRAIVRISYGYRGGKGDTIHVLNDAGKLHDSSNVYHEFVKK